MTTLSCPAKVNLFLAIRGKDASGYHEIETIFARAPEHADEIQIEASEKLQIEFLPGEGIDREKNSISKAIQMLETHAGRPLSYKISVHKNIPLQSGLGGAASDAAAILLYVNDQEKLGLTREQLMVLGAQIGMDVPFFLADCDVAFGTHYGELVTPLRPLPPELKITIEFTGYTVSTPEAYERWDAELRQPAPSSKLLLAAIQHGHAEGVIAAAHNDFEYITPECGPYNKNRHLCGSGGAVFHFS